MNFKKFHESRNLLNEAEPPQQIYVTTTATRYGYEVSLPSGTYTVSGGDSTTFTKEKVGTKYGTAMDLSISRTITLTDNGCILVYAQTADKFDAINVMLNTGSTPQPYEPYSSEVWHDIPYYQLAIATDTITTFPVDVYADGNNATVGISGNTVQNGTPTPDNPIMPQGTGERTGNLFDSNPYKIGYAISNLGTETQNSEFNIYTAKVSAGTQYCLSFVYPESARYRMVHIHEYSGGIWQSQLIAQNCELFPLSFTTSDNIDEVRISIINTTSNHMLNLGSTPLPYEPYGIKIPISSANATTPIYLGEVPTTRRIKKLVLTGNENWFYRQGEPSNVFFIEIQGLRVVNNCGLCTHYSNQNSGSFGTLEDKHLLVRFATDGTKTFFAIRDTNYGLPDLKSYIAAQYAAGTPVTIWYVPANEETAVVNEPLMKIGDYADTVSGITIPTITGRDTFDVDTTLKPSEASLNYTGWHDATVQEWDGSQWNE